MNITEQDKQFMREAIHLANESVAHGGGPFGAVIVKDGEIIAGSSNSVTIDNDPTAHAEIVAIRNACKKLETHDLSGCELYTSCYPCPMCLSAIIWANIKLVYYANTKEDAASIGFRDDYIYEYIDKLSTGKVDKKVLNLKSMNRDEALEVFERYKEDEDKIIY